MAAFADVSRLLSACEDVAQEILSNEDEWEKRDAAVLRLSEAFQGAEDVAEASADDLKSLWRVLKEPLKCVVTDLRSELVRDACAALEVLAAVTRDGFRPLLRDLMTHLVQNLANGNKLIARHSDESLQVLLHECRWRGAIQLLSEKLIQSRSKPQRESCAGLLDVILAEWPAKLLTSNPDVLQAAAAAVVAGVSDASEVVRRQSRKNFLSFYRKSSECQRKAEELLVDMEPRLVKQLRAALAGEPAETPRVRRGSVSNTRDTSMDQSFSRESITSPGTMAESHDEIQAPTEAGTASPTRSISRSESSDTKLTPAKHTKASSATSLAEELDDLPFNLGDQVVVKSLKPPNVGSVRFIGETSFASGIWVGIALPHPSGKNNGTVQGEKYFECEDKHGLFVRPKNIELAWEPGDGDMKLAADEELANDPEAEERLRQASQRVVEFCRCYVKDVLLDMQSLIDAVDKCSVGMDAEKQSMGSGRDAKEALDDLVDALSRTMSKVAPSQRDANEVMRLSREDLEPS
uniref:CAP-Gly domain-containing protein n=1 Tax=Pinguiococcus pyrenoidosus TaxID=172671 RepID=A0A7R9UDW2_9STRA